MNRYGWRLKPLLLALVLLTGLALCEDQPNNSHAVDSDVAEGQYLRLLFSNSLLPRLNNVVYTISRIFLADRSIYGN